MPGPKAGRVKMEKESASEEEEARDGFREVPYRYLGYANEVGEAFRSLVPVGVVRLSYAISSSYVLAHATAQGWRARGTQLGVHTHVTATPPHPLPLHLSPTPPPLAPPLTPSPPHLPPPPPPTMAFLDTLIWQGLASVIIPGFTINRLCALSALTLAHLAGGVLSCTARKRLVTAVGIGSIPLIVKPIDRAVDWCSVVLIRPRLRTLFINS